jgi:hypothetical protein
MNKNKISLIFFYIFHLFLKLFKEGVLTGTQMALLKSKYIDLQNALTQ